MNTILKIFLVSILFCTAAHAKNEYLNTYPNNCDEGSWETYSEVRQHEYKTGTNDESQTQVLGFRWRKSIGSACSEEFRKEQEDQLKIKRQLELVKECRRVPRINPPPPAFAELINMCIQLGVMSTESFNTRDFDPKISYWTELKEKYMKENPDEYITLLSEAVLEGKIKPNQSILSKIADLFTPILRALGFKKIKFDTAEDTLSFLREYHKSIRTGKLSNAIIKATQLNEATAGTKIKTSLSAAAREQITESVKEIGNTYSFKGGKKSWDEGGADNAITEIKQNNYLDDLIAAKFKGDRVPVDFVDKVYTELTNHIRNFNPETNDNLFGWINSQLANKAGNVFNREYKTTVEQRTARDVDDRTKEGEIKTQVADETDVTLEALETQDISPQAEARRKRQAAEKAEPTKSKLRQEIGIEDGSDAYNTVLDTARKVLIRAYDAGKTARQIQRDLTKEASTYLFKQVKNMLGTKAKYIPTIKKFRVPLIKSMFTADLVQMERNVPDNERVFTKFVKKLTCFFCFS